LLFHADILHSYARFHETRVRRSMTTHRSALATGAEESRAQASTGAVEQSHRGETPSGSFLQLHDKNTTVSERLMNKFSNKFSWKAFCRVKLLSTQLAITVDNTLLPSSTVQSFSRSVIPVVYIKSTVDQRAGKWQSKNRTIFVDTIIYQLHTYTCNRYFSSDIVSQPEDGLSRPKHVVGILLYLQI